MKKVLLIIIFISSIGIMLYSFYLVDNSKKDLKTMKKDLKTMQEEVTKSKEENTNYEEEINKLKEENKDKLEELNIWLKAKEKLEKAL